MKFHHVGIAVRNIEKAVGFYTQTLGCRRLTDSIEVPSQKVRVCFLQSAGALLELVESAAPGSPVDKIVEQRGGGPYHVCFTVDDLDKAIVELKSKGFYKLKTFEQAGLGLRRFSFMLTPDHQLIELCEPDRSSA